MKRFVILISIMVVVFSLNAQERIEHKKQMYKAEDGRLYIQKEMPVYLYISTSDGKDAKKVKLESQDSKKYINPMYFDTEGINTFRSPWKIDPETKKYVYPKEDIVFEVYADSKSPKTSIKNRNKAYKKNKKLYFGEDFELDFTVYEALSGNNATYYSIDGAAFKKFSQPVKLTQEKEYKIKYYSIDNVGNAEETKHAIIVIDKTKPSTSIEIKGDRADNVVSGRSEIHIVSKEEGSGVMNTYYRVNGKKAKIYKYPIKTSWFSEGDHKVSYFSEDHVGNKEEWDTFSFFVDKTPPVIVEEIMGNKFMANGVEYSSGRSKFKITTMDNKAGVKSVHYKVGNGEEKVYESPFYLKGSSGRLSIQTWAYDKVNNKAVGGKSNQRSGASYVDLAGPVLGYNFKGKFFKDRDTIFISQNTKIELHAKDSESGLDIINYSVDGKEQKQYEAPFQVAEQGLHKVNYTGYDKVGNTNQTEFFFVVDNSAPRINIDFSVEPIGTKTALEEKFNVYPKHLQVFISATDNLVGLSNIWYKINDGKKYPYNSAISKFAGGRDYKISVEVKDKLGNSSEKDYKFSIN